MTQPIRHLRRPVVNRSECDPPDGREYVDDYEDATCEACREAYARRRDNWHLDLEARARLRRMPPED